MEAVLLAAGRAAPHMASAAPGSYGGRVTYNPQATGDEEGINLPHYSHNYSLTNLTHKELSHVMTPGIITPCLLSVPVFYVMGSVTSYRCQRE